MPLTIVRDETYVLNHCTKYLARDNTDGRHNYNQYAADDPRARIAESWRFPVIDSYYDGRDYTASYANNCVTFIYINPDSHRVDDVSVLGTFADLYSPLPLRQVAGSVFWSVTAVVPKGQTHTYRFLVAGQAILDPVNPQRITMADGSRWSRFFTDYCTDILSFERWEVALLERLTDHILPFRSTEGQRFLNLYYRDLDRRTKDTQYARAYRLDQPVGAVNFIDKIVAREEAHRLADYKICLELIDRLLRMRDPYEEPALMPMTMYQNLYDQLAAEDRQSLSGWDFSRYERPRFFLQLLRRHTYTGAFSHPKHGGNVGAAGWAYLAQNLTDPVTGKLPDATAVGTYFDWSHAVERPLGRNPEYRG